MCVVTHWQVFGQSSSASAALCHSCTNFTQQRPLSNPPFFFLDSFPAAFFFFLQVCEISWQQLFFCLWVSTTSADARVIHSDVHAKFKKHGTSPRLYLRNHASSLWLFPLRRTKQAYPRELRRTLIEAKEMAPLWSVVRGLELTLSIKTRHGWISFVSHVTGRLLSFNTSARQLWRGRFLFCQHE